MPKKDKINIFPRNFASRGQVRLVLFVSFFNAIELSHEAVRA